MVQIARYLSAATLVTLSTAVPMVRRQSNIGAEEPVSAPNGIPMSDTASSTDTSLAASTAAPPPPLMTSSMVMSSMPPMASSMMMDSSSMMTDSSSMMMDSSSMMMASSTMSASMPQMTYGSGSSSWGGNSGYNNCVQQCAVSNPMPSMVWTPSTTQPSSGGSLGGNGVTHTVIVAPTQGVLRYIPFSTNASVGDTVSFIWGAGPHTVTQSSALEVCNKTSAPGAFASGAQNKTFVFNQVINNTSPIWFYCGIPTHCEKGMFGGVNIGQSDPTGSSSMSSSASSGYMPLSSMMSNLTTMYPNMVPAWSYTKTKTSGDPYADQWGMNTNCAGMGTEAMMQTAQNVMYMQTLIAANPDAVKNNKFAIANAGNMTIPSDMPMIIASGGSNTTSMASSAATAASSVMPAATSASAMKSSGAGSITSSSVVVGLVAIAATFFML